ncbi:hypothetical protein H2198_000826 [Neophaeococcomyces mojaviensis]|uniref:Uncharacterized protein n=1 Tax=Neophaeococcomyces mojaviensis TaxID=3383035 RepID=A0ACC3AJ14_9EURO|nr:hypothetical protein H2198_000826 [Knufia sp. JES_112]
MEKPIDFPNEDTFSRLIDIRQINTDGLAEGFELRRHKHEIEADEGSREARADWVKYIGPVHVAGGCNPYSGHFGALVLPTCLPDRLRIISYIFEYAFLHDVVMESAVKAAEIQKDQKDDFATRGHDPKSRSMIGSKQIQSRVMLELMSIDPVCAQVCVDAWKVMADTTSKRDKNIPFSSMEEYLEYRIIDTGAPFVDKHMCFGMGIVLDEQELRQVDRVAHAAYAALGLANDYFSFDVEYAEFQSNDKKKAMTNAVWLFMHWYGVDVAEAKRLARAETRKYEVQFLQLQKELEPSLSPKLRHYVQGLAYQIAGNVVWSTDNPRYHLDKNIYQNDMTDFDRSLACYDVPAHSESSITTTGNSVEEKLLNSPTLSIASSPYHSRKTSVDSNSSISSSWSDQNSATSSRTDLSEPLADHEDPSKDEIVLPVTILTKEVISAPFEYINNLPSKGARDMLIDSLSVWVPNTKDHVDQVKEIVKSLHNISLMLDDVEDGSQLRRGKPSTHMVFGAPQTINSAGYFVLEVLKQLQTLDPKYMQTGMNLIQDLYLGQSYDLYWTRQGICPSEEDYLEMVDKKTGGLFLLAARLLLQLSQREDADIETLIQLLGRYFQIRDDYQNLVDQEYTDQKGFCEDLDEGKYSFTLIHALRSKQNNMQLQALLQSRRENGKMSKEAKMLVLQHLEQCGSFEYTKTRLEGMQKQIEQKISKLEARSGGENWIMRLLVHKLQV